MNEHCINYLNISQEDGLDASYSTDMNRILELCRNYRLNTEEQYIVTSTKLEIESQSEDSSIISLDKVSHKLG